MGNAAFFCSYIDPCNNVCDKKQVLFSHSEWDDPIIIDNSNKVNQTEENKSSKKENKKKYKNSIGSNSLNEIVKRI